MNPKNEISFTDIITIEDICFVRCSICGATVSYDTNGNDTFHGEHVSIILHTAWHAEQERKEQESNSSLHMLMKKIFGL